MGLATYKGTLNQKRGAKGYHWTARVFRNLVPHWHGWRALVAESGSQESKPHEPFSGLGVRFAAEGLENFLLSAKAPPPPPPPQTTNYSAGELLKP